MISGHLGVFYHSGKLKRAAGLIVTPGSLVTAKVFRHQDQKSETVHWGDWEISVPPKVQTTEINLEFFIHSMTVFSLKTGKM